MPLTTEIINSRLMDSLQATFYPQTCSIYQRLLTDPDTYGQPASPTLLSGHSNIACSVQRQRGKLSGERRMDTSTPSSAMRTIYLAGHYTSITPQMLAVVGSITYDIQAVNHDPQGKHTQLDVELVTT